MTRFLWRQLIWPKYLRPLLRQRWLHLPDRACAEIAVRLEHLRGPGTISATDIEAVWDELVPAQLIALLEAL